jgi:hypothetical protein
MCGPALSCRPGQRHNWGSPAREPARCGGGVPDNARSVSRGHRLDLAYRSARIRGRPATRFGGTSAVTTPLPSRRSGTPSRRVQCSALWGAREVPGSGAAPPDRGRSCRKHKPVPPGVATPESLEWVSHLGRPLVSAMMPLSPPRRTLRALQERVGGAHVDTSALEPSPRRGCLPVDRPTRPCVCEVPVGHLTLCHVELRGAFHYKRLLGTRGRYRFRLTADAELGPVPRSIPRGHVSTVQAASHESRHCDGPVTAGPYLS